jgi:hypothetical protein
MTPRTFTRLISLYAVADQHFYFSPNAYIAPPQKFEIFIRLFQTAPLPTSGPQMRTQPTHRVPKKTWFYKVERGVIDRGIQLSDN